VDLEQANSRLALAETNLLTESSNLHDVKARFERLVGKLPSGSLDNIGNLNANLPSDIVSALKTANSSHPALLAAVANVRATDSAVSARKSSYQPRVDFRLRQDQGNNVGGIAGRNNNGTAEFVLSWNLFNGGSDSARVRQYADLLNVSRDQRDKVCRDIRQTLAIAYNDTYKLKEQLVSLQNSKLAMETAEVAYTQQYTINKRTLLDLLDTKNEVFQSQRSYTNAQYDALIASARVQAGMGKLVSTLGLTSPVAETPNDLDSDTADQGLTCALDAPQSYAFDKKDLDARALDLLKKEVADTPTTPISARTQIGNALEAWKKAWLAGDVPAYFALYADVNSSENKLDKHWRDTRGALVGSKKTRSLTINDLQFIDVDPQHINVTFNQDFRIDDKANVLSKTLRFSEIGGKWLIVNEFINAAPKPRAPKKVTPPACNCAPTK